MISVLCPSRGRPDLLYRSVRSLHDSAAGEIEILVAVDEDDTDSLDRYYDLNQDHGMGIRFELLPPAGYAGLHVYYQGLAQVARGDWLMIWNDDAVMQTPRWDAVIEALPPSVLVADISSPHSPLSCFPAVRREAVEALGKFSSDNPHVDTFWQDVGVMTGTLRQVPVYASADSPVKPHATHGFYEPAHQAELRAAATVIREKLCAGRS